MIQRGPWVYFAQAGGPSDPIKIGTTNGDPERRLAGMSTGNPQRLRLLVAIAGGLREERGYHARFAAGRVGGEWFRATPGLLGFIAEQQRAPGALLGSADLARADLAAALEALERLTAELARAEVDAGAWRALLVGPLAGAVALVERAAIEAALVRNGGNKAGAARDLGIGRPNLHAKIRALGLT